MLISCASAPTKLMWKAHHNDHPLDLVYSLPEVYRRFGALCNLCHQVVHPSKWLYYCADCRYFSHIKCVLSAIESGEEFRKFKDVEDDDDPVMVKLPVSKNKPFVLYQLIQQFAKYFSITDVGSEKADKISHCGNGHSLAHYSTFDHKTKISDKMICDGCVQPLLPPPNCFYGCLECNFFLHRICAAELPRAFQHASHPQHKLVRCAQTRKPNAFFRCTFCENICNGMFYSCEKCSVCIDLVCAAMLSTIKHDSHKHRLHYNNRHAHLHCDGCGGENFCNNLRCDICTYQIHIGCARKPGKMMHRWDEHELCLSYPPVKGHPRDFNCERCSEDINPNHWFYHYRKCDTSFHVDSLDQGRFPNIKFGAIVRDDELHQHSLEIAVTGVKFKCGSCGIYTNEYGLPSLKCVSCNFSVCTPCTYDNGYI